MSDPPLILKDLKFLHDHASSEGHCLLCHKRLH
jgi:hypothetical protein